MERVVGYGRVSTDMQAFTHSLEHQLTRLKDAGVDEQDVYHDVESGGECRREQFDKVLAEIRAGRVSRVIATKWDRVTRNLDLYLEILEVVQKYNVVLQLLDGGEADLKSPEGKLYSLLQVAFASHEREKIRERILDGFAGRRRREAAWFSTPWGYTTEQDKYKLEREKITYRVPAKFAEKFDNAQDDATDPAYKILSLSKADIARDIFDYFFKVRDITTLIRYISDKYCLHQDEETPFVEVKDFPISRSGIKRWLNNPVFQGHTAYLKFEENGSAKPPEKWDIRYDTHPDERLISDEEADEVKNILAAASKKFGNPKARFYLTGLVVCEKCGHRCSLKTGGQYSYYGCAYLAIICDSGSFTKLRDVEKAIIGELVKAAQKLYQGDEYPSEALPEVLKIRKKIEAIKSIEGYQFTSELKKAVIDLEKQEQNLMNHPELLPKQLLQIPETRQINFWYTLTQEERKIFYERLVNRVSIVDGKVVSVDLKIQ
jgi:DNA invertase Pin-like site-specific DNA recombinase